MNEPGARPARAVTRSGRGPGPRVEQQPAFVVHTTPWRETSLIVDALTRDHGRIALVARGAKRPTSQFRGLLTPFNPIAISWSGRSEVKSLVRVEWLGGLTPLRGDGLLAAFYLNELVVRLLARGDPHEALFGSYVDALRQLAQGGAGDGRDLRNVGNPGDVRGAAGFSGPGGGADPGASGSAGRDRALRGFELDLLREIGYGLVFDRSHDGTPVDPRAIYRVDPAAGPVPVAHDSGGEALHGASLLAIERRDFDDVAVAQDARRLLRRLIGYHLDGKPLNTRRILIDLRQM